MYFEKLTEKSGKPVGELFPSFNLLVYGGVNYEPYRNIFNTLIGRDIDVLELFPASEGFFAFQDTQTESGKLLNSNSGIFFEFIPVSEMGKPNPVRLTLKDVKVGENYAIIISSNAGLWAYNIGDTVKFVSVNPYRLVVTGRTKHYISAFGEHVIAEEVESSILDAAAREQVRLVEFTVAPFVSSDKGKSYHEWFIEFEHAPQDMTSFANAIEENLRKKNVYYDDLITGHILAPLKITPVQRNGFVSYMKSIGKLGGQNKVPRLSNDRKIAEGLQSFTLR